MNCRYCGEVIPEDSIFCEYCGKRLKNLEQDDKKPLKSMMERFPSYHLKPTATVKNPYMGWWWYLYICLIIFWVFWSACGWGMIDEDPLFLLLAIPCTIASFIHIFVFYKRVIKPKRNATTQLTQLADYVTDTEGTTIFVKDRKFGVLKMWGKFNVLVPAEYDDMEWHDRGKILKVKKDGERFMIDLNNQRLT